MENKTAASKRKIFRHEIVFKRESYFSDVATHFIALIVLVVSFIYFFDWGFVTYVIGLIAAFGWLVTVISLWQDYRISIVIDEDSITEKYLSGGSGGWSYKWSEIGEWNALLVGDGDREIRFTTTGCEPKTHTLPIEKIGKDHYLYLKEIFIAHCGKPTKIDSLMLANAPDAE